MIDNYGHLTPDPGVLDRAFCGLCGTEMRVRRNVLGPRGFLAAISRHHTLHDVFICLHYEEAWHKHILDLRLELALGALSAD
jgi:hypothetical protein